MKLEVQITSPSGKLTRVVEFEREADCWKIALDGQAIDADVVEIAPNIFSILFNGESHEIRIAPASSGALTIQTGTHEFTAEVIDPRAWSGRRHSHAELEGRQQITAPMPGKVVKVLVQAGERVEAGQGLLVVEAMKMQNEIRSSKTGTVERLLVKEGQPVNAGDVLALVD
ncbi:MAG TPA: biotin/lipoyl-containing protein [Candidatus Saccharimonadales bacterium]|nr:biotin/lipoyl-containing protein [Candidatus Saccharimonadales bacterium]